MILFQEYSLKGVVLLAMLIICVGPTCAHADVQIEYNLAYGPSAEEKLDLCLPIPNKGFHPGVILIHGGAWETGDKESYINECLSLSAHGFVAANINYRLGNNKDPNGAPWPAQLVDVQLAVRWMRAHAAENSFDPSRLCSFGGSAGGHLAVFLGVMPHIVPGAPSDPASSLYATESPAVACVVDEFGPIDFVSAGDQFNKKLNPGLFGGATLTSNPDILHRASPVFYVTPHSAPMLVIHGLEDSLVPAAQSKELIDVLNKNAVPVEHIFYQGDHGFNVNINTSTPWKRIPDFDAIQRQILNYFVKMLHP